MKRIIALLLVLCLCAMQLPAFAADGVGAGDHVGPEELQAAIDRINHAAEQIEELKNTAGAVQQITTGFQDFMRVAGYAGTALALVNGSVSFLKLIGVMSDPIAEGVGSILDQLETVNQRITEMDQKLNDLTDAMTRVEASAEFNARTSKAMTLHGAWRDFAHDYGEEGMDALMTRFDGMVLNGLVAWCRNESDAARKVSGVDNTRLVLVYRPDREGALRPVFSGVNGMPAGATEEDPCVILESSMLPATFDFNVNDYHQRLSALIAETMLGVLSRGGSDALTVRGIPGLTPEGADPDVAASVASDLVDVLVYRIGCGEVNRDATFALDVDRRFTNYCNHLFGADEGLDAALKTFYLTHAFESEAAGEMADLLDRMQLKVGTYGTFVTAVLGMSSTTLDSAKQAAMDRFCKVTETVEDARRNCVTGNGHYCYITNSELVFSEMDVTSEVTVNTERIYIDKENYKGYVADPFKVSISRIPSGRNYAQIGDKNALLIYYTLQSEGMPEGFNAKLNELLVSGQVRDRGRIVTSFGTEQPMPKDGQVTLQVFNVIGDDFEGRKTFKLTGDEDDYPDDADPDCIYNSKKLVGSLLDPATGKLTSNTVLHAMAVYGQSHWNWFYDEAAILSGPADLPEFSASCSSTKVSKFDYEDTMYAISRFTVLVALEPQQLSGLRRGYDPLNGYADLCRELENGAEEAGESLPLTGIIVVSVMFVGLFLAIFLMTRKKSR